MSIVFIGAILGCLPNKQVCWPRCFRLRAMTVKKLSTKRLPPTPSPAEFEIPDDWWAAAGMSDFTSLRSAYNSARGEPIQLVHIEPPFRPRNVHPTSNGFNRERFVAILKGFRSDAQLPPIDLLSIPSAHDISGDPFEFRVIAVFHRFYASIAACSSSCRLRDDQFGPRKIRAPGHHST
jgi:hypothetical protein